MQGAGQAMDGAISGYGPCLQRVLTYRTVHRVQLYRRLAQHVKRWLAENLRSLMMGLLPVEPQKVMDEDWYDVRIRLAISEHGTIRRHTSTCHTSCWVSLPVLPRAALLMALNAYYTASLQITSMVWLSHMECTSRTGLARCSRPLSRVPIQTGWETLTGLLFGGPSP